MIEAILCTPDGQFALIGLCTNAIIGLAAYHLGTNNPNEKAKDRIVYGTLNFLTDHPQLFELALCAKKSTLNLTPENTDHK